MLFLFVCLFCYYYIIDVKSLLMVSSRLLLTQVNVALKFLSITPLHAFIILLRMCTPPQFHLALNMHQILSCTHHSATCFVHLPCLLFDNVETHNSFIFFTFIFRERGREGRKRGRETLMCGCLSCAPYWGPCLQPRHVP